MGDFHRQFRKIRHVPTIQIPFIRFFVRSAGSRIPAQENRAWGSIQWNSQRCIFLVVLVHSSRQTVKRFLQVLKNFVLLAYHKTCYQTMLHNFVTIYWYPRIRVHRFWNFDLVNFKLDYPRYESNPWNQPNKNCNLKWTI